MLIPYTATLTSERLGDLFVTHVECEVEAEAVDGDVQIDDVLIDGTSLFRGEPFYRDMASRIANEAERSDFIKRKVFGASPVYLKGGIGNPSAKLVRAQ